MKLFLAVALLLVGCAHAPDPSIRIRHRLLNCLNTKSQDYCFDKADNLCLNADLEPDCHGVDRR